MVLTFGFALLFLSGCVSLERDNVYDPYGNNYIGGISSIAAPSSSSGVAPSSSSSASPPVSYGTLPYQGQNYKTVQIGTQTWMAENLNYDASGSKCYDNDPSNCATYGRLYNWETANAVCPSGWHLPTNVDWTTLTDYVGGASTAGSKLKAVSGWNSNGNGSDAHGFSALPGGIGNSSGSFDYVGYYGYWWSSTENSATSAYIRYMDGNNDNVYRYDNYKSYLYSVRCLQN